MERFPAKKVTGHDFLGHFILHGISDLGLGTTLKVEDIVKEYGTENAYVEVELTIGGRVVPVSSFMQLLERQLDEMVAKQALDLFEEKLGDLHDGIDEVRSLMRELKRAARRRLNLPPDEDDWG